MPRKFAKNLTPDNQSTETKWASRRKRLPKNWCQIISDILSDKGLEVSSTQVSDIRIGKIKNTDLQLAVWAEINKLEKKIQKRSERLLSLKK